MFSSKSPEVVTVHCWLSAQCSPKNSLVKVHKFGKDMILSESPQIFVMKNMAVVKNVMDMVL